MGNALGWGSAQLRPGWARWWLRAGPVGSQAFGQCRLLAASEDPAPRDRACLESGADRILRRAAGVQGSVSGNRTLCSWRAGPGFTRGRGAAAAGRRRPRAVRPSVRPRPPAAAQQRPLPARPAQRRCGRSGLPRCPPGGTGPAPRCLRGTPGEARPAPRGAAARGKGRPRQGLMPPHLRRPGRGGRGRRRSGAVTAAAPAPLPNR